ncbi:MAG: cellulose biosynthesis cyclic di-GMP-binding regulatory protein BcsB [Oxalicibacterium faecigallinarum]|uniref:cellulose biosynthesis cyclic di-GMP-binding regulatory protein BcsB n=1 Tax=Oxalicibacterium faecigallinarum TaxID=573741 RepID=UPI002809C3D9|nr:cellulose biosynthesis cyclic di-GMP-binding regulatory protein BcsB [Oxalicibacterium faecigallinarum]MDQ7968316.1 cellulose biosynthesis cyclic di-GMP-binding regulatory protein BcsB [Oxalicibacterium faecigallinarum]
MRPISLGKSFVTLALLIGVAMPAWAQGFGDESSDYSEQAATSTSLRKTSTTLRRLGMARPMELRGIDGAGEIGFSVRLDEVVAKARLNLSYTLSPALLPGISHLKVFINDEIVQIVPVTRETVLAPQRVVLDLDPRYMTDYNKLRIQLIGHYTMECESPFHSSLWATISNESTLEMEYQSATLTNDLAIFPAPFFDARDNSRLNLPFVFDGTPDLATLRAAGVLASWFGSHADYRQARFPTFLNSLPNKHAIVFLTNAHRPAYLPNIAPVNGPTISMVAHPTQAGQKLLLILGRDAADLQLAADAITLGKAAMTGASMTVKDLQYPKRKAAYDVPRWIPVGRPVRFGELVKNPFDLQTRGITLGGVTLNARMPADLFGWDTKGVLINLKYRHTPVREGETARLNVEINDEYVDTILLGNQRRDGASRLQLPILGEDMASAHSDINIPAFRIGSNNRLYFRFDMPPSDSGHCRATNLSENRAEIDPDSTLDLSRFDHYAAMPNLSFFANNGFPFTKFADLAETTVVISDQPKLAELSTFLGVMGSMGASTGAPATYFKLVNTRDLDNVGDTDILLISDGTASNVLEKWGKSMPALIRATERSFAPLSGAVNAFYDWFGLGRKPAPILGATSTWTGDGPLAAILGFQSPISSGRSVVALTATSADLLPDALNAIQDPGKMRSVRGDLALIGGAEVQSFRTSNDVYYVGHLPWWRWIWFYFNNHPFLVAVLGIFVAILVSLFAFRTLRGIAARRLQQNKKD